MLQGGGELPAKPTLLERATSPFLHTLMISVPRPLRTPQSRPLHSLPLTRMDSSPMLRRHAYTPPYDWRVRSTPGWCVCFKRIVAFGVAIGVVGGVEFLLFVALSSPQQLCGKSHSEIAQESAIFQPVGAKIQPDCRMAAAKISKFLILSAPAVKIHSSARPALSAPSLSSSAPTR